VRFTLIPLRTRVFCLLECWIVFNGGGLAFLLLLQTSKRLEEPNSNLTKFALLRVGPLGDIVAIDPDSNLVLRDHCPLPANLDLELGLEELVGELFCSLVETES